jgi:phosphoglycerol geranylgeranyltransferase
MYKGIYASLLQHKQVGRKSFAVLVDPDKVTPAQLDALIRLGTDAHIDYFFIGGSLLVNNTLEQCVQHIKQSCNIPIVLFPGSNMHICHQADAILYLSLISGRNPDLLISKHVESAPLLYKSPLEVISTGYMLIDGGVPTSVSYMSNTQPIPYDKVDIALCTALAGELLGMKLLFLDAGSGAIRPISEAMIHTISHRVHIPLIVGGGIHTPEKAVANARAGADLIVVGNAIENNANLLSEMAHAVHTLNSTHLLPKL